jgi:hypothetical protein
MKQASIAPLQESFAVPDCQKSLLSAYECFTCHSFDSKTTEYILTESFKNNSFPFARKFLLM